MPGRSPYEAWSAFVSPLTDALSCVATAKAMTSAGGKLELGPSHTLHITGTVDDGYVKIGGPQHLEFRAHIYYEIIRDERDGYGPYRVTTRGYDYSICRSDRAAVLDYHWHPNGQSHEVRPHIHLGSTQLHPDAVLSNKQHLTTGRVTFETAIRQAVDLGAVPRFEDWSKRLDTCEGPHLQHRTWSIDFQRETGKELKRDRP